jgi:ubiquinone/menaquinone biosynthesis C-methylase UbiE
LPHPDWALAEWYRVLKPGGVLVVGETTPPARGRPGAAEFLRFAGFADVESRESSALASEARGGASWFRRLTRHAARTGVVTWGTRP